MLVTTVGGSTSDSFIGLEDANTFLEDLTGDDVSAVWTGLTDAQQEERLKRAASLMGFLPLRGLRAYTDQILCFPRTVQVDVTEIPAVVGEAQVILAYQLPTQVPVPESIEAISGSVKGFSLGILSATLGRDETTYHNRISQVILNPQGPIFTRLSPYLSAIRRQCSYLSCPYRLTCREEETYSTCVNQDYCHAWRVLPAVE
jgi:hypothetical protein